MARKKSKIIDVVQLCILQSRGLGPLLPAPLWDPWRFVGERSRRVWGQERGIWKERCLQRSISSSPCWLCLTQEKKPFEMARDAARSHTKHASQTLVTGKETGGRLGMKLSLGSEVHAILSADV